MNHLNERALLGVHLRERVPGAEAHLRLCADCAERYDQLVDDLETIGTVLETPPVGEIRRAVGWQPAWIPVAVGCAALAVVALHLAWRRPAALVQEAANTASLAAFTDDLSDALFPVADADALPGPGSDLPYVEAALEAGQPCTSARFFNGECNDQVSALLVESE
jgi:hypothetical protein